MSQRMESLISAIRQAERELDHMTAFRDILRLHRDAAGLPELDWRDHGVYRRGVTELGPDGAAGLLEELRATIGRKRVGPDGRPVRLRRTTDRPEVCSVCGEPLVPGRVSVGWDQAPHGSGGRSGRVYHCHLCGGSTPWDETVTWR